MTSDKARPIRAPSLLDSLLPIMTLIVLIALSVYLYGVDATLGPLQVALFMATVVGAVIANKNGHSWEQIAQAIVEGISVAMSAIFILLMVGGLIGLWNMSGTIATIVYYGLELLNPTWFYFTAALITGVVGLATAIGLNIFAGDQYVAIILPTRMFLVEIRRRNLHPETLATAVENSGTVTSPLIPWNSCGAYMTAALGVSTFLYFPYCFFNFLNPLLGLIYGFTGFKVQYLDPEEAAAFPIPEFVAPLVPLNK